MDNNKSVKRRRIKVGLLVSHLEEDFDDQVCEGAMIGAEQADVNLVIFPGRYVDGVYADKLRTEYEYQYNTLFDMAAQNKFDVLLVLIGTLGSHLDKDKKAEFLKKFGSTPVITITARVDGYPCVMLDNRTGLAEAIEHLITVHGCRRIGFMSGPKTSEDAQERLDVYKEVLKKHGILYDDKRVGYGNFSKYVVNEVGELLDNNPDIEALVFANDQMAVAGYKAMEKRGIRPGKDIFVTGFDNEPVADELIPHLTTVKADPAELGYNAVIEAVKYIVNGAMENEMVPSSMVCRNSCGCQGNPRLRSLTLDDISEDSDDFDERISALLFDKYRTSEDTAVLRRGFSAWLHTLRGYCNAENICDESMREKVLESSDSLSDEKFFNFINSDMLFAVLEYVNQIFIKKLSDPADHMRLNRLFLQLYKIISERNSAYCKAKLEDNYFLTWQTNSITRDMLVFEAYDDRAYESVVDKLTRLHMDSSYLFSYDSAVINLKTDKWTPPKTIKLKSYHNGAEAIILPSEEQEISSDQIFSNKFLPQDRRFSMVVSPLFSNEEHYGLLMCELKHEYFHYIQSVTVQLCAALKIIMLMKQQAVTRKNLQKSLIEIKEYNQLLSDLSRQDELTGCFNRRGFFEELRKRLSDDANDGAEAIMVFADLDCLKTINDRFGHEEGDFAIRSAAEILKESFGDNEIVGRIGGDEFAVCAFLHGMVDIPRLRDYIESVSERYNALHAADKPYIVHISVGVYSFVCTGTVEITELLSHADALLYEQKKHKKSILKSERS